MVQHSGKFVSTKAVAILLLSVTYQNGLRLLPASAVVHPKGPVASPMKLASFNLLV